MESRFMRNYTLSLILLGAAAFGATGAHAADRAPASVTTFAANESPGAPLPAAPYGTTMLVDAPRQFGPSAPFAYVPPPVTPESALFDSNGPRPYEPFLTGIVG